MLDAYSGRLMVQVS